MVKWDAWGGEGERNYLVVKRVKRVRETSRELCTERERESERERQNTQEFCEFSGMCFVYK